MQNGEIFMLKFFHLLNVSCVLFYLVNLSQKQSCFVCFQYQLTCNIIFIFFYYKWRNLSVFQASAKNDVLKVCRKEYEVCVYVSGCILLKINCFINSVKSIL